MSKESFRPYFTDDSVTLHLGDALDITRTLPTGSADCIVTSPPYFGLRDYKVPPRQWPAMSYVPLPGVPAVEVAAMTCALGLEPTPHAYVGHLVLLFDELRRVLVDDGTIWLNLGDSYASNPSWGRGPGTLAGRPQHSIPRGPDGAGRSRCGVPTKNLLGIPWQVAFALQATGLILRNANIWEKPNSLPESVTDRLSSRYEEVFLLTKSRRYWFDLDAIRQPTVTKRSSALNWARDSKEADVPGQSARQHRRSRPDPAVRGKASGVGVMPNGSQHRSQHERGRNPGDVWSIPTQPFHGAHFAVMAPRVAQRCVAAGCRPGGTVLDPFSGVGTSGWAAQRLGRKYIGIDLSSEALDLALRTRLRDAALDFEEGA